jgi:hypothetical protein
MRQIRFEEITDSEYFGKLPQLQAAWARFMAEYLKAGLQMTRRYSPRHPEGELLPLPALQLLTGDPNLKAWKAYDMIKSICQLSPEVFEELRNDAVVGNVLERALRSRRNR